MSGNDDYFEYIRQMTHGASLGVRAPPVADLVRLVCYLSGGLRSACGSDIPPLALLDLGAFAPSSSASLWAFKECSCACLLSS